MTSPNTPHQPPKAPAAQRVAVVCDSATALPEEVAREAGLLITPMEITIGGRKYEDGPNGVADGFYDLLREAKATPRTSAPNPAAWLKRFEQASEWASSIVCITLAAKLSASYDSARVAVEMAHDARPNVPIKVIDSDTAAGSEALIALATARAAARGDSLQRVVTTATNIASRVRLLAYLDTLEYVWKSGRVPRVAVWASTLFNVKPVMEFSRGRVGNLARPRSRQKAMDRILIEIGRSAGALPIHVAVMHADAAEEAQILQDRIKREFNCVELIFTQFAAFMGAHTGPGLVGASFWVED